MNKLKILAALLAATATIACDAPLSATNASTKIQEVMALCRSNGSTSEWAVAGPEGSVRVNCLWAATPSR